MRAQQAVVPEATGVDPTRIEETLESLPGVARACVARRDARGTVVFVALDADTAAIGSEPELALAFERALTARGHEPTRITVRIVPGWLPGRDAFPAPIRSRCVRARYAHLLASGLAPIGVAWGLAT